jgi:alpha-L-rhamnosidase
VLYRTYDVTNLLRPGSRNTIGLWASAGWSNYVSFKWASGVQWQQVPLVSAELRLNNKVVMTTDATWECRDSNTSHLGPWGTGENQEGFGGDFTNASMGVPHWDTPEVSQSDPWSERAIVSLIASNITITSDVMEPTKRHSSVAAVDVAIMDAASGGGGGGAGGGANVTVTMAELYTGWFEVDNLRSSSPNGVVSFYVSTTEDVVSEYTMIDRTTTDGDGIGSFRMRFSYHEIHYITMVGLASPPKLSDVRGWRLSTDLERTGFFNSSSELMNDIYDTTVNNYLGLTTGGQTVDCPHRERRGYGGDAHTSYQFALANFQVGSYFTKWARDFADVQQPSGDVPHTAPTVSGGGGPAWSGFVVTLPWEVYRTYGDTSLLLDMYPTMQRQLKFYRTKTRTGSDQLLHAWDDSKWDFLGDWITPHGSEDNVTSPMNILFNNCYLHYITTLAADIAQVLDQPDDAKSYRASATSLAEAVNSAFYDQSTGAFVDQLQTHLL